MKKSWLQTFYNPLYLAGAVVFFNTGLMTFLFVVEMLSKHSSTYVDIIIFIVLPFITLGLVFSLGFVIMSLLYAFTGFKIYESPSLNDEPQRFGGRE